MNDKTASSATNSGRLLSLASAAALINAGETLAIAGDADLLARLPRGRWIGGSIPYFMAQDGGEMSRERVFVTRLPTPAEGAAIRLYPAAGLDQVCLDAPANGYSIIIIPAFSAAHSTFARQAPDFEDMFVKPLIGWIAGVHLDELTKRKPCVVNGQTGEASEEQAVVIHVPLPDDRFARVDIVNLFAQGPGDRLRFPDTGFSAETCLINGRPTNFAQYLLEKKADLRFPLVANYSGAMVNVSLKGIDREAGRVDFYAPVFDDIEYRLADSLPNYVDAFTAALADKDGNVAFSCNCILNYLYSELEGKRLDVMPGPMTFGEIAYQLLNQTLVYLQIEAH